MSNRPARRPARRRLAETGRVQSRLDEQQARIAREIAAHGCPDHPGGDYVWHGEGEEIVRVECEEFRSDDSDELCLRVIWPTTAGMVDGSTQGE